MSTSPNAGADDAPVGVARPLPAKPSLEFERKEAKGLLRRVRRGDPESIRRVRTQWHGEDTRDPTTLRLADIQLTIAREYGFTSWPRLVSYFETLARHERSMRSVQPADTYEWQVHSLIAEHRDRRALAGEWLATFVPRFHGGTGADALAASITIDEARLVVARQAKCASWDDLMAYARKRIEIEREWERYSSPRARMGRAIRACDIPAASALLDEHPELIGGYASPTMLFGASLVQGALMAELRAPSEAARAMTDWFATRGEDFEAALGGLLCTRFQAQTRDIEYLLARGADPGWVAPNGITALEHAIARYWNAEAVELLAQRTTPREAFWIAAALGDVRAVARYVNADGSLIDDARRNRADFTAIGPGPYPSVPDAPDVDVIWEAFFMACLNERADVVDLLLARGFPIDYNKWNGMTALNFAVGNRLVGPVAMLVQRGASLDSRGRQPDMTARELSRMRFQHDPSNADGLRILELCQGGDSDELRRTHEAERAATKPQVVTGIRRVIELAMAEAARRGQTETEPDNLFVALFNARFGGAALIDLEKSGAKIDRILESLTGRLLPSSDADPSSATGPALGVAALDVMDRAGREATSRKSSSITWTELLLALADFASPLVASTLLASGFSAERLRG